MKKTLFCILCLLLCISMLGIIPAAMAENAPVRVGELIWIQEDENQRSASIARIQEEIGRLFSAGESSEESSGESESTNLYSCKKEIIYYDNLNSMLMALKAGEIEAAELYTSVCRYISHRDDQLEIFGGDAFNASSPQSANRILELNMLDAWLSVDFSFMFMKEQESLRDLFNGALEEMEKDGTMGQLYLEDITNAFFQPETVLTPVEPETIENAETIRVGVTGDLPPIDYFGENGKPAGYNTRILSEISRRIGKNIEFVSVDSGARLLALNSGKVDVIFWARNHTQHDTVVDTAAWKAVLRDHPDLENNLTAEEEDRIRKVRDAILSIRSDENEQMEGTLLSKPFYSDWYAYLVRKE